MNVSQWLTHAESCLASEQIASARLDALILLEDHLKKSRSWLLAHPEYKLDKEIIRQLDNALKRRSNHEPLAYIRGKSEFFGYEFMVSKDTLQPRPETETMLELLLDRTASKKLKVESIVDVGTGSGAIAISAKLALPDAQVYATDCSKKALQVARENAKKLSADIAFYQGNLLKPLDATTLDVIMANLPYVPDDHVINQAAMFEPALAIFGGKDGLDLYREMFDQLGQRASQPQAIFCESLPYQHKALADIAAGYGYSCVCTTDFIQLFQC